MDGPTHNVVRPGDTLLSVQARGDGADLLLERDQEQLVVHVEAAAQSLEAGRQLLQQSGERQVDPHGVRPIDHWRDESYSYCVLEAADADAVCQQHADHGVPCDDLHTVERSSGEPAIPAEDERLVRAAMEDIWHSSVA